MKPLPPPDKARWVLSFDFDGTLHDPASEPPVPDAFFDRIGELRRTHAAVWGINTGRSLPYALEGFVESRFPFLPDWVVTREREVWLPGEAGDWLPHASWNQRCETEIHALFTHAAKLLARIRSDVAEHTGAQWVEAEGDPAGIISRTSEEMDWIVSHIRPLVAAEPLLAWQRNSIYLRFSHRDYHKGSALGEVASLFGLAAENCFAIGDSHNDFEMLDPAFAARTACPANSVPEILSHVRETGGCITSRIHGAGAIEALEHYFGGGH